MATIKPILYSRADASGKYPVKIRITKDQASTFIPLGFSVKKAEWNKKADNDRKVRSSHPNHVALNEEIVERLAEVKRINKSFAGQNASPSLIRDVVVGKVQLEKKVGEGRTGELSETDLFAFTEDAIAGLNQAKKIANADNTAIMLRKLRAFWEQWVVDKKHLRPDRLPFEEMTVTFLKHFENYMLSKGVKQSTAAKSFSRLRRMLNEAIGEGKMQQEDYPFRAFKIRQGKPGVKTKLTVEDLRLLFAAEVKIGSRAWDALNIFRFQFYIGGIRIGDCLQLRWENVQGERLVYAMSKTEEVIFPKLEVPALAILDSYRDAELPNDAFIFPFLSHEIDYSDARFLKKQISAKTALINKYLKMLAKQVGIQKKVTTHVARHSMADYLRRNKADVVAIKNILGHGSLKTTENYLASLDQEAVDDSLGMLAEV